MQPGDASALEVVNACGTAAGTPGGLPTHLQFAVHRTLSDLQASRLLYPQRCAAAEAQGGDERRQAEQRVLAALGGTFDYAAARGALEQARQSAKQLLKGRGHGYSRNAKNTTRGGGAAASLATVPEPTPQGTASGAEEALWSSFEAFSAAVAAEVDERIAAARLQLHPSAAGAAAPGCGAARLRSLPGQQQECRTELVVGRTDGRRQPLGRLQQQQQQGHGQQQQLVASGRPSSAQERKRTRERSPQAAAAGPAGQPQAGHGSSGRRQRAGASQPPVAAAGTGGSPASKRRRPHVAFGTRCDAPRGARSAKPMRLDAAAAPTPPALPPAVLPMQPDAGRPASPGPGAAAGAKAGLTRSDLLRSLAAAFGGCGSGGGGGGGDDCGAVVCQPASAAGQGSSSSGNGGLQCMINELTAALQGLTLPAAEQSDAAGSSGSAGPRGAEAAPGDSSSSSLQSVLELHGIPVSAVHDASTLLQAALDRMDGIAERAKTSSSSQAGLVERRENASAAATAAPVAPQPALALCGSGPSDTQHAKPTPTAAAATLSASTAGLSSSRSQAAQLCRQLSQLLDSSGSELRQVRRELDAAKRAEAALEKLGDAALEAALGAAEKAAAASCVPAHGSATAACAFEGEAGQSYCGKQRSISECHPRALQPTGAASGAALVTALPGTGAVGPTAPARAADEGTQTAVGPAAAAAAAKASAGDRAGAKAGTGAAGGAAVAARQPAAEPSGMLPLPVPGWPVPWQLPLPAAAVGVPLMPPGQPQWVLPAAAPVGCAWQLTPPVGLPQQPAMCAPGMVQLVAAANGPQQQEPCQRPANKGAEQEVAEVEEGASFSVASDEPVPDSPTGSYSSTSSSKHPESPVAEAPLAEEVAGRAWDGSEAEHGEGGQVLQAAAAAEEQKREEEQQQKQLDELATLSIQQYQQHAPRDDQLEAGAAAADAWDVAMHARGRPTSVLPAQLWGSSVSAAAALDEANHAALGASAAPRSGSAEPSAAWMAGSPDQLQGGELPPPVPPVHSNRPGYAVPVDNQQMAVAAPPSAATAAPQASPARPAHSNVPVHLPLPQPYQPLKADEERAAAARQAEAAAGWRQLRERADMLVLWHEYAAELGLDGPQPGQQTHSGAFGLAAEQPPTAAMQRQAAVGQDQEEGQDAAQPVAPPAPVPASAGLAVLMKRQQQLLRLWQPAGQHPSVRDEQGVQPMQASESPPASLCAGPSSGSICSDGGTPSCTILSSYLKAESSDATSIGVAGRHKARALRYHLLRRQLAAAAGLEQSPVLSETSMPDSSSIGSSISSDTASSCSGSSSSGGAGSPALAATVHHGARAPIPPGPAVEVQVPALRCTTQYSSAAYSPTGGAFECRGDQKLAGGAGAGDPPATPLAVAQAVAAAEAAAAGRRSAVGAAAAAGGGGAVSALHGPARTPAFNSSQTGDASDATPSSFASATLSPGMDSCSTDSSSMATSSSCSTLQGFGSWPAEAAAAAADKQRVSGVRSALQALKARRVQGRRSSSSGNPAADCVS